MRPLPVALRTLAVLVVALVPIRIWVAEPLHIATGSMAPTLVPGEHVLSWKLPLLTPDLSRGDVVAVDVGHGPLNVKRVVGLGGDRVAIRDGALFVNGRVVHETYADPDRIDSVYFGPVKVPDGEIFVMGDDRRYSRDSRSYGPVPLDHVDARVSLIIWPINSMGGVAG